MRVNGGLGAKRWQGKGLLGGGLAPCQRLQEVRPVHLRLFRLFLTAMSKVAS